MLEQYLTPLIVIYLTSILIQAVRVLRGPTVPDSILALDTIVFSALVLMMIISIYYENPYLSIGVLPLAAWIFLLDIVVSRYLIRKGGERK